MSDREALQAFFDKSQTQWPEWALAEVFVPVSQRELARAWLALRGEWADAAWAGVDPVPGAAKLGWWQEELQGWARNAYRHPLGQVLQKQPVDWATLAQALPALAASRVQQGDLGNALRGLEPVAQALAATAAGLFAAPLPAEAQDVAVTLLGERALRLPPSGKGHWALPGYWPCQSLPTAAVWSASMQHCCAAACNGAAAGAMVHRHGSPRCWPLGVLHAARRTRR